MSGSACEGHFRPPSISMAWTPPKLSRLFAPTLPGKKRMAGPRLWVDRVPHSSSLSLVDRGKSHAQRMVDELLWAAVKSHTVKEWGKGDSGRLEVPEQSMAEKFHALTHPPWHENLCWGGFFAVEEVSLAQRVNRLGQTLLFEAAQHVSGQQAFEISQFLIKHGVSATAADIRQQHACFYAAKHGHSQLCELLITQGCRVSQSDAARQTALFHSVRNGHVLGPKFLTQVTKTL
eukprot:s2868_g4.t1